MDEYERLKKQKDAIVARGRAVIEAPLRAELTALQVRYDALGRTLVRAVEERDAALRALDELAARYASYTGHITTCATCALRRCHIAAELWRRLDELAARSGAGRD